MSDDLTHQDMEAIATVVARLARGRGWVAALKRRTKANTFTGFVIRVSC